MTDPIAAQSQTLEEAYIFAYPLVLLDLIREMATNTEAPTHEKAPINQLFHARDLATPEMASLTRPNVDTVYSQAYLDLREEPMLFWKPEVSRYCTIQVFDGYSNTPCILGTGEIGGNGAVTYAFTGPSFKGTLPDGVIMVPMDTNLVWLLIRTRILGREDLPVVHEIQNAMKIYPLSAYGKAYTPPRGVYTKEKDFVALKRIGTMDVQEFFDRFNRLAVDNPASPQDAPALEKFSALGIGPGQKFRLSALSVPAQEKARTLPGMIDTDYSNKNAKIEEYNHWMFMDPTVGCFGTDYKFRAVVAYGGFANPVKMAIYPSMVMDGEFHLLDGKSRYRLHFGKDRLPPHHEGGWWSLTGYDAAGHLIDNELDRYHLDDKSDFVFEEDGSLVLSIQSTQPDEKVSNWLPVCEDIFSLTLRIYLPADAALEHTWIPPVLERL
ncbi:DUF1254 domain-containing protein [Christensenella tenuis]|uniref:DUF1254 domain-containing protein n=1 Tax=Christensenella tenuis TaxID=2763033 RepID=A0ABR7EGK0_9FIRM|nr:DUF1254 domain-containing protein [Christensenella tenuis]MBC5648887.1 DUF1254 domain-containing protein [Christensenella tenuis]